MARFDRSSCCSVRSWEARELEKAEDFPKNDFRMNMNQWMNLQCQNQERSIGNWTSFSCSWKLICPESKVVEFGTLNGSKRFEKPNQCHPRFGLGFALLPGRNCQNLSFWSPIFFWARKNSVMTIGVINLKVESRMVTRNFCFDVDRYW